jgi:hypothetical protein
MQYGASVSPLKPLSHTLVSLACGTENGSWILDLCSKIGNFKGLPVEGFLRLNLRAASERDEDDRYTLGKPIHGADSNCLARR